MGKIKTDFYRNCPQCYEVLFYSTKNNLKTASNKNSLCKKCAFNNKDRSGDKNPFYGKSHSQEVKEILKKVDKSYTKTSDFRNKGAINSRKRKDFKGFYEKWIEKYGIEQANLKLVDFKKKLSIAFSGKNNPMFGKPPPSSNKGNVGSWSGWYKNWFFRSFLELSFAINVLEKNNIKWESGESINYKIPYLDIDGKQRNYFPDFIINDSILVEIKPKRLHGSPKVKSKKTAAEIYCKNNNLTYQILEPNVLSKKETLSLYYNKEIILTKNSEKYFKKYFKL